MPGAWDFVKHWVLPYRTTKHLIVDSWQIGLSFRALQACVLAYAISTALQTGTWVMSEVPAGSVNAYGSLSDATRDALALPDYTVLPYCGDAKYSYWYSSSYDYRSPECENVDVREVVQKGPSSVFVTTVFIEEDLLGWPCTEVDKGPGIFIADDPYREKRKTCFEKVFSTDFDGTGYPGIDLPKGLINTTINGNNQCTCSTTRTVYPVGVEDINIYFEHAYDTTEKVDSLRASALDDTPEHAGPLETTINFVGEEKVDFKPPAVPYATVKQLLALGGITDINEAVAHSKNTEVATSGGAEFPTFRTTGVQLQVNLKYSNDPDDCAPVCTRHVHADVEVLVQEDTWAGWGAQTYFPEYPRGARGQQTYHKVIRYRQGVVLEFRARGLVYIFDPRHLLNLIIATVVLLGACSVVIDAIVFYMLPCGGLSTLLYRKRNERVNRQTVFATLGLRAAMSVQQFQYFDQDEKGFLTYADLVRMFGKVQEVDYEKACAIAQTVLAAVGTEDPNTKEQIITFTNFVSLTEGNSSMQFDKYITHIESVARQVATKSVAVADAAAEASALAKVAYASEEEAKKASKKPETVSADEPAAQTAQPFKVACAQCRGEFWAPAGADMARCPYCQTINQFGVQQGI